MFPLTTDEMAFLEKHKVRVVEAPWSIPPGLAACDGKCSNYRIENLLVFKLPNQESISVRTIKSRI
jgi:hypothetical protein